MMAYVFPKKSSLFSNVAHGVFRAEVPPASRQWLDWSHVKQWKSWGKDPIEQLKSAPPPWFKANWVSHGKLRQAWGQSNDDTFMFRIKNIRIHTVMLYICIIVYCLMVMCHWKNYNQDDGEHPLSWVMYLQSQCQKIAHKTDWRTQSTCQNANLFYESWHRWFWLRVLCGCNIKPILYSNIPVRWTNNVAITSMLWYDRMCTI